MKYTFNLSDDDVVAGWVENPYRQYLSGMKFFEHVYFPIEEVPQGRSDDLDPLSH